MACKNVEINYNSNITILQFTILILIVKIHICISPVAARGFDDSRSHTTKMNKKKIMNCIFIHF
jgi:hypothetical protein